MTGKRAGTVEAATALVGDIGGTNARFALADVSRERPVVSNVREYPSRNYASGGDAVRAYLAEIGQKPKFAAIAAAGPITHGAVHFTNLGWTLSETDLVRMGFSKARLINDFESLALAAQHLEQSDLKPLGTAKAGLAGATVAVIGPGTGFGAAALVRSEGRSLAMATEGGHVTFAPTDDIEREIALALSQKYAHVSIERVLSGPGLKDLHETLDNIEGISHDVDDPTEITKRALQGDRPCLRTIERFCAILGSTAGDFALVYGARGGVFIAGGIAPQVLPILEKSEFRQRFEAKGRFKSYLAPIPTQVILHDYAAFLGAGEIAHQLAAAA